MNTFEKSTGRAGMTQRAGLTQTAGAGRPALARLGKLEDVLASDASLEVKAACIELAILAEDRAVRV